jgi:putative hydrolase of the HAD superfamily
MHKSVIFDLDDTLYKEIDYVRSGFSFLASLLSKKEKIQKSELYTFLIDRFNIQNNPFQKLIKNYNLKYSVEELLYLYRNHEPKINLDQQTIMVLDQLKNDNFLKGLLTDGRSMQQRKKIKSLGLIPYFKNIVISEEFGTEKPVKENYVYFVDKRKIDKNMYFYIGDNPKKDFITPNKLGWITICIKDNGKNIHNQSVNLSNEYFPAFTVDCIKDLIDIIYEK